MTEIERQAENKDFSSGDTNNSLRGQVHGLDGPGEKCYQFNYPSKNFLPWAVPQYSALGAMLQMKSHFPEPGPFCGDPGCGLTHVKGHKSVLGHAAAGFMDLGVSNLKEFYGEWRHKMSC